jgi:hypothetical protein
MTRRNRCDIPVKLDAFHATAQLDKRLFLVQKVGTAPEVWKHFLAVDHQINVLGFAPTSEIAAKHPDVSDPKPLIPYPGPETRDEGGKVLCRGTPFHWRLGLVGGAMRIRRAGAKPATRNAHLRALSPTFTGCVAAYDIGLRTLFAALTFLAGDQAPVNALPFPVVVDGGPFVAHQRDFVVSDDAHVGAYPERDGVLEHTVGLRPRAGNCNSASDDGSTKPELDRQMRCRRNPRAVRVSQR